MRIKKQRCSNCEKRVPIKHILNTNYGVICRRCYNLNLLAHSDLAILDVNIETKIVTAKEATTKTCPNCQTEKLFEAFGQRGKGERDESKWANSWCKICRCKRSKLQRREVGYKEKHAAYMREYRKRSKKKAEKHQPQ